MKALQNGSDIRGIAIETSEYSVNLTAERIKKIAVGTMRWLREVKQLNEKQLRIAIGRDSRLSGENISKILIETFIGLGIDVLDVEMATTPAMFMATQFSSYKADAAIMVTASHLPYFYNGLKFFTSTGGAEHEDIEAILSFAQDTKKSKTMSKGHYEKRKLIEEYAQDMVRKIRQQTKKERPLEGFKIIVDAGNGAGGFFADKVLHVLGADTTGSQFLEPDGHFPYHIPNPDNKEAMASIQQAVIDNNADLGVIFDTDVDRAAVVANNGQVINRNNLIAVLATIVLDEQPGATIVTNSPTSSHLKIFIEHLGGKQIRYLSGYRNVINKAIDLNTQGIETPLAIETSGHAAFKENYFLDDGAYVIAKILMLLPKLSRENRTLSELIQHLKQPAEAQEVRLKIAGEDYEQKGRKMLIDLEKYLQYVPGFIVENDNEEGVRINANPPYGEGWFLVRMSLHEPLLVIQAENDQVGSNKKVFNYLLDFFQTYDSLNLENLKKIIKN